MKFLQNSVGLRGYAQKDPLMEYKLEGFALYQELLAQVGKGREENNRVFSFLFLFPLSSRSAATSSTGSCPQSPTLS